MKLELKAVGKQSLKHLLDLLIVSSGLRLCHDVVTIGTHPRRAAGNLKISNVECVLDQPLKRLVRDPQ